MQRAVQPVSEGGWLEKRWQTNTSRLHLKIYYKTVPRFNDITGVLSYPSIRRGEAVVDTPTS